LRNLNDSIIDFEREISQGASVSRLELSRTILNEKLISVVKTKFFEVPI